ncbi:aconitase family protein [Clohesyomyces aquaticus]|uniref:Aconitase family protein n=1 Tax=Clohesyomyces aquaticus TaxID=1231657 RepID=A0A1Y1ZSC6_9PLEO|nr:aconitase family protein [Clohesyomyces aquaticus]
MDQLLDLLKSARGVDIDASTREKASLQSQPITSLLSLRPLINHLQSGTHIREAQTLSEVSALCTKSPDFGGLGLMLETPLNAVQKKEVLFLISAWLEALNSADRAKPPLPPLNARPKGRRGMTLTEKIFAMHDVERSGCVKPGRTMSVSVDWILASDASWGGMERTYRQLNQPGIFRNDRFWLALDHVVDPRINHKPEIQRLIEQGEDAKEKFKMTEYQGQNYTILHTEFYRSRAEPGMIAIGSDSHTCSSGAVGCLSIGLGAADVTLALVTGEIWFKIPEIVNIRLVGKPGLGIGGKDVILYILQQLRRNTVAADRVVEYTGPGLKYLSSDARFAIANMTTEFGGITGIFVPDGTTYDFVNARKGPRNKANSTYFRPDEDAEYAATHEIDLSNVKPFIAKYPNPDDVVAVTESEGFELDGCFIGACTTAEEDILLGALVLEQGLKMGKKPVAKGKRKVVPGSRPIRNKLEATGLADVYRAAGFEIGIPGCSYCVGMSADKAEEGEVWLSSQNRNFENRMGRGSIGNLASSATVAASSFDMKASDPSPLIEMVDLERWNQLRQYKPSTGTPTIDLKYVEPVSELESTDNSEANAEESKEEVTTTSRSNVIAGKVQRLGDYIDTDALAPAQYLIHAHSNEAIGAHCLEYTNPEFREKAKQGFNIVVAGKAFGCGSSRQEAVMALIGCGVKCVIAPSFAFIYSRNQPSLGLVGITITDPSFYELANDGVKVSVNLEANRLKVADKEFGFEFSQMEKKLMELGGITQAFHKYGKELFQTMCKPSGARVFHKPERKIVATGGGKNSDLQW